MNEEEIKMEKKSNACGIVGICVGWIIPLVGVVCGIVSLARREDSVALGVLAIVISVLFWVYYASIFMSMF